MISSRQQRLLKQLMEARQYIPLQQLADEYEISLRTIRHDLLQLEDFLRKHDIILERSRSSGVYLQLDSHQSESLALQVSARPIYMDAKQRMTLLLKQLLQETNLSMGKMLSECEISKNTLLLDLSDIKNWLEQRRLALKKERGTLSIVGSEQLKRSAYLELLRAEVTDDKLLGYMLSQPSDDKLSIGPWNVWFNSSDAMMLFDSIQHLEQLLGIQLTDAGYSTLTLHLLMAMERLKHAHAIEMDQELLRELESQSVYKVIQAEVIPAVEAHFQVTLPASEIGYMTQHVLGAQKQNVPVDEELYIGLAKQIITRTEQALGHRLQMIDQIVQGLVIHLKPAIYRAKFDLQSKNPLLEQLKVQYGSFLHLLEQIVNDVMEPIAVTFDLDEVGYIMLHIGSGIIPPVAHTRKRVAIVCGSGIGTSAIIKRRLSDICPQVDVVNNYSYKESRDITLQDVDAVLTTIDIGHPILVPWLKVSPLLTSKDQQEIAAFLGVTIMEEAGTATTIQTVNDIFRVVERNADIHNRNKLLEELLLLIQGGHLQGPEHTNRLSELLPTASIRLQLDSMDWESAIQMGCQLLSERSLSGVNYEERLVEMIDSNIHSFIIHDGVAFPHANMPGDIRQTGFSLVTFREPISFGPLAHPVWLIITLAAVDKEQHVGALSTLLDALNDEIFMTDLQQSSNSYDIWRSFREKEEL